MLFCRFSEERFTFRRCWKFGWRESSSLGSNLVVISSMLYISRERLLGCRCWLWRVLDNNLKFKFNSWAAGELHNLKPCIKSLMDIVGCPAGWSIKPSGVPTSLYASLDGMLCPTSPSKLCSSRNGYVGSNLASWLHPTLILITKYPEVGAYLSQRIWI